MPDITMCRNKDCPKKLACYRWCAVPDRWQSYSSFTYSGGECKHFAVNQPGDKLRKDINENPVRCGRRNR